MSSYMKDSSFRKHFQRRLQKASGRKTNPIGSDYNRAQQAMNATLGKMNQSTQAVPQGSSTMLGAKLEQAQRNRNREQSKTQVSKPTQNAQAMKRSLGSKLYGG